MNKAGEKRRALKIAVASGKGGTGKTTVSTSLAVVLAERRQGVYYLDLDVEEPNGHIFLRPEIEGSEAVTLSVPVVDPKLCNGCGLCAQICRFQAIVPLAGGRVLTFPELCRSCGGCTLVCPTGAIGEAAHSIGVVESGRAGSLNFMQGRLNVGEHLAVPVIRTEKQRFDDAGGIAFLDSPPGSSCPVAEAVKDADYVIVVTEPTPYGLNDLKIILAMIKRLGLPCGVVINRSGFDDDKVYACCRHEGLPVLAALPDDRAVAEMYSRGQLPVGSASYRERISRLGDAVLKELGR